jgi:exonuclease III
MRIDYVLVEEALAPRVRTATVCGRGAERDGFLGSDHWCAQIDST